MDQIELKWTKQDQSEQNGPNGTKVDKWAELDRSGLNQTEVYKMDRIEPMWTERPNRTKMD